MTPEDILRMAREAGFTELNFFGNKVGTNVTECLARFAALVAAHERERLCADLKIDMQHSAWDGVLQLDDALRNIDAAIRARGKTV